MTRIASLPARGVIAVAGADRVAFLQGLVSNDVTEAAPGRALWAALLTPQGKWLADFFVLAEADRLLLDVERAQIPMLLTRLGRFRLRAAVSLATLEDWTVLAAWDGPLPRLPSGAVAAADPRLPAAGWRILLPAPSPLDAGAADTEPADGGSAAARPVDAGFDAWDRHRLALGLPDGTRDLESEKTVLLEAGFDELGGISWTKGCYMGQELTARTRYRGLREAPAGAGGDRGRPARVRHPCPAPGWGAPGRSGNPAIVLRPPRPRAAPARRAGRAARRGAARLTPRVPGWMHLPETTP